MALSVPLRNETPFVLFSDGDADEHNRTWSCTRGSSLVRSPNGSLLAFFSGLDGCADGARRSALLLCPIADPDPDPNPNPNPDPNPHGRQALRAADALERGQWEQLVDGAHAAQLHC